MRTTVGARLLFSGLVALISYAQTPDNAVQPDRLVQQAVNGAVRATLDPTMPKFNLTPRAIANAPSQPASACAIPLREMKIPEGVNFTIGKAPVLEPHDAMATPNLLPPCAPQEP